MGIESAPIDQCYGKALPVTSRRDPANM